jgi:arabinogalactan oligomer/maltooligosaccharide transport system substrate-binding protein
MRHEWRKKEKNIYMPKVTPTLIDMPSLMYFTIEGIGNPNSALFSIDIAALYAMSYAVRMAPKAGIEIENYFEYTVYPLEGMWSLTEQGIKLYNKGEPISKLKDYFKYKLMIKQPDFVTEALFDRFKASSYEKTTNDRILDMKLETINEGLSCQMLHVGSYDNEILSFEKMEAYCKDQGYRRLSKDHKEIYLSDARKVAPDKLKTTLRFQIKEVSK